MHQFAYWSFVTMNVYSLLFGTALPQALSQTDSPLSADRNAFNIVGFSDRTTNKMEMSKTGGKIGPLWQRYSSNANSISAPGSPRVIYVVYSHYESNEAGAYDVAIGQQMRHKENVPPGMISLHIPAARYLVFRIAGDSPAATMDAWRRVYKFFSEHPDKHRAYSFDFEEHGGKGTEIFVAIK